MTVPNVVAGFARVLFSLKPLIPRELRTRVYCVGTAKSGTHSIADMFSGAVRAQHEPQAGPVIQKILDAAAGRISHPEFVNWVRARDQELALELDSSQLNFFLLDILLAEFPDALFVLTIRDCYSWLDSFINHVLRYHEAGPELIQFRDFRFQSGVFTHGPQEKLLKKNGLHTLDGYLSYWAMHNEKVISSVPRDRLFIVRTDQIRQRAFEITDFARLPRRCVDLERTHSFKNPKKFDILRQLDRGFLEAKVEEHCGPLMSRFFPEIKSLADAKL